MWKTTKIWNVTQFHFSIALKLTIEIGDREKIQLYENSCALFPSFFMYLPLWIKYEVLFCLYRKILIPVCYILSLFFWLSQDISNLLEEERNNAVNSVYYVLPATPKGSTCTSLQPTILLWKVKARVGQFQVTVEIYLWYSVWTII